MVIKPANIKGANKDAKIYVSGRSTSTVLNLLFYVHTLCMNYVTNSFLLVGSSVQSKQLLRFVHSQSQKSEQKHTTNNFVRFQNHSPLLTMVQLWTVFFVCQSNFHFHLICIQFPSHWSWKIILMTSRSMRRLSE